MQELVSIVVPVFNVEEYLDRCVSSIVNQTYKNLEILLIDDGSPDNCPKLCDEWAKKDSRIKVIHKENEGQGIARSLGIEVAKGEYITFFDSDDYVDITIIEKSVSSAKKYNSDVVIYGRKDYRVDGSFRDNPISTQSEVFSGKSVQEELLPGMLIYKMGFGITSCRLYRLSTLKKYNLRFKSEREYVSEDTHFSLELFSKNITVSIVPEGLYFYCERPDSFSRKFDDAKQEKNDIFLKRNSEFIVNCDLPQKTLTHLKVRYHFFTIATIKQLMQSSLSKKEKNSKLREIFSNELLRSTLTNDVLSLEKTGLRLFYYGIKYRCYFISRILLEIKLSKGS